MGKTLGKTGEKTSTNLPLAVSPSFSQSINQSGKTQRITVTFEGAAKLQLNDGFPLISQTLNPIRAGFTLASPRRCHVKRHGGASLSQ